MSEKKSKKRSKGYVSIPTFKIEQSEKMDITANSGLFLVAERSGAIHRYENFSVESIR